MLLFLYLTVSLDYKSDIDFDMPGVLLYTDGDRVTLSWTPSDVLPTEVASPNDYQVTVEVYAYTSNAWSLFEELDTVENTGIMTITGIQPGPVNGDPIVPIAFHIRAIDSVTLKAYIRPILQANLAGIWSPVSYKITNPDYDAANYCSQFLENQDFSGSDLLQKTVPCPCRASQARIGNSMLLEQRSSTAVQMRRFFSPKADTCFLSTVVG